MPLFLLARATTSFKWCTFSLISPASLLCHPTKGKVSLSRSLLRPLCCHWCIRTRFPTRWMRRGRVSPGTAGLTQGLVWVCENSFLRVSPGNIVSCINVYTLSCIMHRFVLVRFCSGTCRWSLVSSACSSRGQQLDALKNSVVVASPMERGEWGWGLPWLTPRPISLVPPCGFQAVVASSTTTVLEGRYSYGLNLHVPH